MFSDLPDEAALKQRAAVELINNEEAEDQLFSPWWLPIKPAIALIKVNNPEKRSKSGRQFGLWPTIE